MPPQDSRPTERFSDRVDEYVRYRPSYPVEVVRTLEREAGIRTGKTRIVDLGCGTGISAELFLQEGYSVVGVEPNLPMRAAAEARLGRHPRFRVVDGTAESTSISDSSCELIVAAQAFHWFDRTATRLEIKRLLRPDGVVALLWNDRKIDSSPFLREYEAILRRYGTDYVNVVHRNLSDASISDFFGPGGCERRTFPNHQDFDLDGLIGRAMSSSYLPRRGHPDFNALIDALSSTFARHAHEGEVRFEYDTRLYFGRLSG